MAGRADLSLRRLAVNSLRRGLASSTTSMARVWRRKPWVERAGLGGRGWVGMVFLRGGGGGGGGEFAEGAVVGAEVVAPGGDAVGFVDGDESGLAPGEHLGEAGDAHAFGC